MNNELKDIAGWSLQTAKTEGAGDCRVSINSERFIEISYRDRKPENIKEASTRELYLEVFVNQRYSGQNTSDLRKEALKNFIHNAVTTTKLLAEDPYRTLPDPKYYQGRSILDLDILDPDYIKTTPQDRHALVKTIEESALDKGGNKVISVTATQNDSHAESVVLTSNGFEGTNESTSYWAGAEMTIQDKGNRRPSSYNYVVAISKKDFPSAEKIGAVAAQRTLALLGAKKIKTQTLPVIIENRVVPTLLNGFVAGMYGRNIQQKRSFLADQKGKKIGSAKFTLLDHPLLRSGLRSRLFDDDGFATRKRSMVEAGVLKDFYIDWYYSRKLGWEPTSGNPANLFIPPGKRSIQKIMKDLGRGILITDFLGGNSNSTTGDTSMGIIGTLFEKGELVQPVSEMNIADNHLKFWHKLAEVADDPWIYSSWRTPSLVFTDVVVSGL
jgi:PmbA protein